MSSQSDASFVVHGKMELPYQYFAGTIGSKAIVAMRDEKRILAVQSPSTGKTYFPPREVDDVSFERLADHWVDVGPGGEIVNYTVVRYTEPYQPKEPPYVLALIKLDRCDTPIVHLVEAHAIDAVSVGMRVSAVFADEAQNNVLDIAHFAPE